MTTVVTGFFFSSRRRHTRLGSDWSSDVCSSDLGLPPPAARKALAAARCMGPEQGSLTVIATASQPIGGETTVIALSAELTQTGRFPALDLVSSGTLRPELL